MKTKLFSAFAVCLLSFTVSNAQNDTFKMPPKVLPVLKENYASANSDDVFTVGKVTGDIGKAEALYLPKPFYPGEAKQDSAEGKIYVQIAIDEKGNVTSARSMDGHPALRKMAEETALVSKFRAPKVDNQPTKSEGWLIYNFEIAKPNWIRAAYELAFLHSPFRSNQKIVLAGIRKNLKPDWTTEIDMVSRLEELTAQMPKTDRADQPPSLVTQMITKNGEIYKTKTFEKPLPAVLPTNPEQLAVTQNLINALQSRLATDEIASWQFNLAFAILQEAFLRRESGSTESPEMLKTFLQNAPQNLSSEYKTELADLINLIETDAKRDKFDRIQNSVIKLQKLK